MLGNGKAKRQHLLPLKSQESSERNRQVKRATHCIGIHVLKRAQCVLKNRVEKSGGKQRCVVWGIRESTWIKVNLLTLQGCMGVMQGDDRHPGQMVRGQNLETGQGSE